MTESVEIHEFSTGIRPERTADGGWVSRGFTGQYMNATIDPIPDAVQRSIANKEFAVAEGASSNQPAVIGRVVGSGESAWSVVAIVTRGRDEHKRSASLYHYFLCKGDNRLPQILAWIEEYKGQYRRMPVFNPFEETKVEKILPEAIPAFSSQQIPYPPDFSDPAPVIIRPDEYNELKLHQLHQLAEEKAYDQPVAWAFNVEALEQLRGFQIIQSANTKAYELLQNAKFNTQKLPVIMVDEQAIKSAIKGLINSSTAQIKYIEAITNDSGDTQIDQIDWQSYWRNIFDGHGADKALKQGIYSPQMVRLLTLRSLLIPQTLPEYLSWLEKGNKQNNPWKVAAEFEFKFRESLSKIPESERKIEIKINEGFEILLFSLLTHNVDPKAVNELLASNNGLWRKLSGKFIDDIEHDLRLMKKSAFGAGDLPFRLTNTSWQKIRRELQVYWSKRDHLYHKKYQPFAELFLNLNRPQLSAFFYHVGYGQVPKKIFAQLQPNGWNTEIYGVVVQREITGLELLGLTIITLGGKIVPVAVVIPIVLISLILGFGLRGYITTNFADAKLDIQSGETNQKKDQNSAKKKGVYASTNKQDGTKNSVYLQNKEDESYEEIIKISNELSRESQSKKTPEEIQNRILDILNKKDNIKNDFNRYQKKRNSNNNSLVDKADGVIIYNQITSNVLKCEVANSLKISLQDGNKDCDKTSKN